MLTVVFGVGYTGTRILQQVPEAQVLGLSRSLPNTSVEHVVRRHDLDQDGQAPIELPQTYSVIYTIPPAGSSDEDSRLSRLF